MKGDFSRVTFDPRKHFSGVRLQQGRVQLDADWNEQMDILQHQLRAQLQDLVGQAGTLESSAGFGISVPTDEMSREGDFIIHPGRYFVGGRLCESDRDVRYLQQPEYPDVPKLAKLCGEKHQRVLAFLDVWERDVSAVDDPDLLESALGGIDTTTRIKTIWQVKVLPLPLESEQQPTETKSPQPDAPTTRWELPQAWHDHLKAAARKGRMRARFQANQAPTDNGLYAPDNHLYRVEIHRVDRLPSSDASQPDQQRITFKWSRENGSVAFRIVTDAARSTGSVSGSQPNATPQSITVTLEGLQQASNLLQKGDLVEISDEQTALLGQPGTLFQILEQPDLVSQTVQLVPVAPDTTSESKTHVWPPRPGAVLRRWDQNALAGNVLENGLLVAKLGEWQAIEEGVEIRFSRRGDYHAGDYWMIPVRSHAPHVQWPTVPDGKLLPQFPHGIRHQYAPLAILVRDTQGWRVQRDCRNMFQSATENLVSRAEDVERLIRRMDEIRTELRAEIATALDEARGIFGFPSSCDLERGQIVALDPKGSEQIVLADTENARLLLGVVLERTETESGEKRYRIATRSIVPCRVIGPIDLGELLVPSETPGCATCAGFFIRPGTLLGKAVSSFTATAENPQGTVNVLLTPG